MINSHVSRNELLQETERKRIILWDIETTGFEKNCKIVEISCLELHSQKMFHSLVNPGPEARIHSAVPHPWKLYHLEKAPAFNKMMKDLIEWLGKFPGNKVLLAHNGLSFDANRLINQCEAHQVELPANLLFDDSIKIGKSLSCDVLTFQAQARLPGLPSYSLESLLLKYGFTAPKHEASADVKDLQKVLSKLKGDEEPEKSLEEYLLAFCTSSKRTDELKPQKKNVYKCKKCGQPKKDHICLQTETN